MDIKKAATLFAFAFIGWVLCFGTMGLGMAVTSLENALIIHAVAAPVIFTGVSLVYFKRFNYTNPLQTALVFVAIVITLDFFLVAMVINRSFEMFTSFLGTWIPFLLIFLSTWLTGLFVTTQKQQSLA
jgi:hypothetical protein